MGGSGGSGGAGGAGGAGVTSLSDLCGTRTRNIHPKHILQTQSSVLVPEPNPAVGSVYKVGSTVISFIVVDSLLRFLIVLDDDVTFTAPPSVPADADPPQVLLLSKQMNEPDLRRVSAALFWCRCRPGSWSC